MRISSSLLSQATDLTMKTWKNAATLIVSAPAVHHIGLADFQILMLKRSAKSSFYANSYVFPGGASDKADFSNSWLDLYNSVDSRFLDQFKVLHVEQNDGLRPPMFLSDDSSTSALPKEVAYRICAIRETFEESGILITRGPLNAENSLQDSTVANAFLFSSLDEVEMWRKKVHDDAFAFLDLCKNFSCVPDIWALHEWCDWLTPRVALTVMSKRFDTVFYKTSLSNIPNFFRHDSKEITNLIWKSPEDILAGWRAGEVILGPPQIYELARLLNFNSFDQLSRFTKERSLKGMERWLPYLCETSDGHKLMLYPGDRHYPQEKALQDETANHKIPFTYKEILQTKPRQVNHGQILKRGKYVLTCDYVPRHGHVAPVEFSPNETKSKI